MGRSLIYDVSGSLDAMALEALTADVDLVQTMMNHHFTWSCEPLALQMRDEPDTATDIRPPTPGAPLLGHGWTKVRDDDWDAALVLAFLEWLSARAPKATVRVHDEGDLVRAGYLVIRNGRFALDRGGIARQRAYLESQQFRDALARLAEAETMAARGDFFAHISAEEYANRQEIQAMHLGNRQLKRLSVRDVAHRLTFPWQTEWIERP